MKLCQQVPSKSVMVLASLLVWLFCSAVGRAQDSPLALPERILPKDRICFALYTVHEKRLKLTAQFYPIENFEPFEAQLHVSKNGQWQEVAVADIVYPGYTATFRVNDWDDSRDWQYRVTHNKIASYEGSIRKNPVDQQEFVLVALSCNSVYPAHGGSISKSDIVDNLQRLQPDLLFFAGDQVYDHSQHYLYWLQFGRDFGEIIRNTPTICIPDDHDIGQGNLWGAGGKRSRTRRGSDGGYYMPVAYVQEVERAQTSHLPDPFDPTPVQRGIGVYYTDLKWGGMSFAILEDRKFKTGPEQVRRKPSEGYVEAISEQGYNTLRFDAPQAKLLGDRQLEFLEHWTTDWQDAEMKAVLSQTIFAQACNYSGKHDKELLADFDSNGWPQTGRNKALATIRKSFSCMIAGDQHLATVIHHGINNWGDAGYSFCTPAIANYWLRWWDPKQPGKNRLPGAPKYTGEFLDGFQNKITMHATANPTEAEKADGGKLSTRAAGFGVVKFDKSARSITFECWPRNIDITDPDSKQFEGWPVTISQRDNFRLPSSFVLPTFETTKPDQVFTVRREATGETVYSLRVRGRKFQPVVPAAGVYRVDIGEGDAVKQIRVLRASSSTSELLRVNFD